MRKCLLLVTLAVIVIPAAAQAQLRKDSLKVMQAMIIGNDTILVSTIPELNIYPQKFESRWEAWRYRRLIRNVKAAYPYAKIAGEQLRDLDLRLASMRNEKQKKKYIDETEDRLRDQFEAQLTALTITQGRILIKLVYRETGNTTYQVIQDVKGNFSAGFWQAVARLFGSNLKSIYNPETDDEDKNIEYIIQLIDMGMI